MPISPAHAVQTFGCVRCTAASGWLLDADLAHSRYPRSANASDLAMGQRRAVEVTVTAGLPSTSTRTAR